MEISVFLEKNDDILINQTYSGNFDNEIIKYNDGMNNRFDIEKCILSRQNADYTIQFDFKKSKGSCLFDDNNFSFDINVIELNTSKDKIYIKYIFNDDKYLYSINWR